MAHIFVIDDEPILLELISDLLRLDGHKVTTFSDPLSIFESLCGGQTKADLLLTDVEMKPINGFDVVRRLCLQGFSRPVIFMSGYPGGASKPEIPNPQSVIEKPFTAAELRATVQSALSQNAAKSPGAS